MKNKINHCLQRYYAYRAITPLDMNNFIKQLSILLSAGIPLTKTLETLEKSAHKLKLRNLIHDIKVETLAGKSLYESFSKHDKDIDNLTCHLIKLGEHTGRLESMLAYIADYHEKLLQFKTQIKQALFYPCMTLIFAIAIIVGMLLFIIPRFADLFQTSQVTLPWLTKFIFYCSIRIKQILYAALFLLAVSSLILTSKKYRSRINKLFSSYFTQLPFIYTCWHNIVLTRFMRQLSISLNAGLPLTDALKLITNSYRHHEFVAQLAQLRSKISTGLQLHQAMASSPYFPILMTQMIKIGEESGTLESILTKIADTYETQSNQFLQRCHELLEPLIMLVLGVLIGGIVIGMYLPIFKLGNTL